MAPALPTIVTTPALPTVVHLDADAFFVSCELAVHPELRGTKCAVGGRERGIISSASYEARACGVYTPMATKAALRTCPDLILLPHTSGIYSKKSREMFELCETITPLVQRNSVDEGYLDLAPCGFKTAAEIERRVRALQQQIWEDLQIPTSFGIAANKLVAAIASKARKPKGFTVVPPGTEAEFLAPMKVSVLPGVEDSSPGRSLAEATDLEAPFYPLVEPLLKAAWTLKRPLRLVSVRFSNVEEKGSQLEMFGQTDDKKRRLAAVLDQLNDKGKKGVVRHGHQLAQEQD